MRFLFLMELVCLYFCQIDAHAISVIGCTGFFGGPDFWSEISTFKSQLFKTPVYPERATSKLFNQNANVVNQDHAFDRNEFDGIVYEKRTIKGRLNPIEWGNYLRNMVDH